MMSNNKELLNRLSEIVDGLSEENYEKSMSEMHDIFDRLSRDTETLSEIEKIFGYDDVITKQADAYLAGNPSSIDGMKAYLKNSLGMIEPMEEVKPKVEGTHLKIKELPNGQKAAVITKITSEVSPAAGEEMVKLVTGEISEPSEVQKVDSEIKEILDKKDSIDPENFSDEELKLYNNYMNNFSEEVSVDERAGKEFPIIDTTIEKEHPLTEAVSDLKECFENMEPDQAAFALAKIGSQTRVEVSDALFAEIYSDTNELCKNFASTATVYGTELEKAGEIINSLFSEEGSDTNFSEVEQELYNRYQNNFSYMENELNNEVNFSEEEVAFANQFSENELIELLNYSDEELLDAEVPAETVEVISSIRDKVACPVAEEDTEEPEVEEEAEEEKAEEETEMSEVENFGAKAEAVKRFLNRMKKKATVKSIRAGRAIKSAVDPRADLATLKSEAKILAGQKGFKGKYDYAKHILTKKGEPVRGALARTATRGAGAAALVATPTYGTYRLMNNSEEQENFGVLEGLKKVWNYMPDKFSKKLKKVYYNVPKKGGSPIADQLTEEYVKSGFRPDWKSAREFVDTGVEGVNKLGRGVIKAGQVAVPAAAIGGTAYMMNNSDAEEAPEVLSPEQTAQVVDALSQKLADADLSKEEAAKVLVAVEDKVSPEIAEAVQADVLKEIDARFSEVVEALEITPEEVEAAEEVIDSAIEDVQKERAGEQVEAQFSAYGITSFNKYCANFAWAEEVLSSLVDETKPEEVEKKVEEKIDEVKAEKVAEESPAAESEEVVKEVEEKKEELPIEKTDEPTTTVVTELPANKTDEPTLSKEDAVSNFSEAPVVNSASNYANVIKRTLGF